MNRRDFCKSLFTAAIALAIPTIDTKIISERTLTFKIEKDIAINLDDFSELIIRPAAIRLAEEVDKYIMEQIIMGEFNGSKNFL